MLLSLFLNLEDLLCVTELCCIFCVHLKTDNVLQCDGKILVELKITS